MVKVPKIIIKIKILGVVKFRIIKILYHLIKKKVKGGAPEMFIIIIINKNFVDVGVLVHEVKEILLALIKNITKVRDRLYKEK